MGGTPFGSENREGTERRAKGTGMELEELKGQTPSPPLVDGEGWTHEPGEEDRVWYSMPTRRRIAYVVYGLFYGALSLLVFADFPYSSVFDFLIGPLLGYGSFHFLRAGLSSKPRFEMTADGIVDRTFMGGGDLHLAWREIRDLSWTPFGGQLEVLVADLRNTRERAGWPRRFWMLTAALRGKKTISIIPTSSGPNLAELGPIIQERLFEFERSQMGLTSPETRPDKLPLPFDPLGSEGRQERE